jgi:hypothetical protein
MPVHCLNENFSTDLKHIAAAKSPATKVKGLDVVWLRTYMETLRRAYLLRVEQDAVLKKLDKRTPEKIAAYIKALKRAELEVRKCAGGSPRRHRLLRDLRQEIEASSLIPSPKGRQLNYRLAYSVYWLAENIKKQTGQPCWELVAEQISEYLPVPTIGANDALKLHRRFGDLLKDRSKFRKVIMSNLSKHHWTGTN